MKDKPVNNDWTEPSGKKTFKVLQLTDIHLDNLY